MHESCTGRIQEPDSWLVARGLDEGVAQGLLTLAV